MTSDPYQEAARRRAEAESTAEEVAAAQKVYLFHDFNEAMARLWKKYGVVEVQEQCRSWVEFIDHARAVNAAQEKGTPDV